MLDSGSLDVSIKAFDFASDLAKQLITLSSGIVALTITFTKDVVQNALTTRPGVLLTTWILYLLSILMGIATLMALTGSLQMPLDPPATTPEISLLARQCEAGQIIAFLLATISLIVYGWTAVRIARTRS